jgi:hypothetical protein
MRYFLFGWAVLVVLVVSIAGFQGGMSRRTPIEVFPDMDRQPRLRPQEPNRFFADGLSSQLPVAGTIPRSAPFDNLRMENGSPVFPHDDSPVNTGMITGTTNWVEVTPFQITENSLIRGRQRYQIYCAPCHGAVGDGNGITRQWGMGVIANLHERRLVEMTDGEIFHVITHGRGLMGDYGPKMSIEDRWAVIGYVRALQLSRLGSMLDVPEDQRAVLQQ